MKRCMMCGHPMRVEAELVEGDRCYTWHKCINMSCGSVFLAQRKAVQKQSAVDPQTQANAAAG